ncbi:hypothetical protein scyTo_0014131 [Scyliorhinus torazame]|uniref:Uncharacterized protein n=1 Tax=Scyliorhinus torazame TaxID=75743 RepID=A0A401NH84_SCYTO|nr:hypothetical protein [Scyliorhinus torazame]
MVRRFLVTLRPFRIFVAGIGFFTLCFIMTSFGGQFSGKRVGDSPFGIRQLGIKSEVPEQELSSRKKVKTPISLRNYANVSKLQSSLEIQMMAAS